MKPKEKEVQKVDSSVLLRRENKTFMGGNNVINKGAETGEKIIQRRPHLGTHSICSCKTHTLLLMPSSAYWQGSDIGRLLRGSARAILIQRRMLAAIHQTEHRGPSEGARERTEGSERVWNPIERTKLSINKIHHSSQGLKHQPISAHGETHGPRQHCLASMRGENFGPGRLIFSV